MPSQKRSLDEHDELDDRHDAKRQVFDASILLSPPGSSAQKRQLDEDDEDRPVAKRKAVDASVLPSPPSSSAQKRRLEEGDEGWPDAKRKALEAPTLPTSPPSVSARKRPLEIDDTSQPHAKRPALLQNEFQTAPFRQRDRMELYIHIRACRTWNSYCRVLNSIPKKNEFTIALALNDSAEWARLRALSQLDAQLYSRIIKTVSEIQMDKNRFDPKSLFPCVATTNFMETLPPSARKCNICRKHIQEGFDIVWKFCGNHTLHNKCFRESVDRLEMPLIGVCDCIPDVK